MDCSLTAENTAQTWNTATRMQRSPNPETCYEMDLPPPLPPFLPLAETRSQGDPRQPAEMHTRPGCKTSFPAQPLECTFGIPYRPLEYTILAWPWCSYSCSLHTATYTHLLFFAKSCRYGGNRQPGSRQRASPARNTTVAACARTAPAVMPRSTMGGHARSNITFDKLPRSSKCPYMSRCDSRADLTQHDSSHEHGRGSASETLPSMVKSCSHLCSMRRNQYAPRQCIQC